MIGIIAILLACIIAAAVSEHTRKCDIESCRNPKAADSDYCSDHTCKVEGGEYCSSHTCEKSGCTNKRAYNSDYCSAHQVDMRKNWEMNFHSK